MKIAMHAAMFCKTESELFCKKCALADVGKIHDDICWVNSGEIPAKVWQSVLKHRKLTQSRSSAFPHVSHDIIHTGGITYILCVYIHIYIYIYMYIYIYFLFSHMYVCMYVYIYIYICIYTQAPRLSRPRPRRRAGPEPEFYIYIYIYTHIH